jgi:para-aminobenzoate synthetase component 1
MERVPLIEEVPTPFSPVQIFELIYDEPHSFFLDSGMDVNRLGRYSFLGSDPFLVLKSWGERIEIREGSQISHKLGNPFDVLSPLVTRYKLSTPTGLPPFLGGAVGYFGYDLYRFIEEVPSQGVDDILIPDCYIAFYDTVIAHDHLLNKTWVSSSGLPEEREDRARRKAREKISQLFRRLSGNPSRASHLPETMIQPDCENTTSNFSKDGYINAITKAKEYIASGDIYQVNLSQRFRVPLPMPPLELYKVLRTVNPAPFAGFLNWEDVKVLSSSPERFLRISRKVVETRPIKGTRPRGRDAIEDRLLYQELLKSKKDNAELIMIIDLERNDLGRVCEYGSVRVPELITLETYATVHHLVSTVVGRLCQDKNHIDCLKACFPGGSITGAPKIRAMEIIDELEPTKRKVYTGSIGYIGFNEETDLDIVIRTMLAVGDNIYFQAGGGIVADSDPEKEYEETIYKAKGLIYAVTCRN